jgi:hypothetical protein
VLRSLVRPTLLFAVIFAGGYFALAANDAPDWAIFALIVVATFGSSAIDRWLTRRVPE